MRENKIDIKQKFWNPLIPKSIGKFWIVEKTQKSPSIPMHILLDYFKTLNAGSANDESQNVNNQNDVDRLNMSSNGR